MFRVILGVALGAIVVAVAAVVAVTFLGDRQEDLGPEDKLAAAREADSQKRRGETFDATPRMPGTYGPDKQGGKHAESEPPATEPSGPPPAEEDLPARISSLIDSLTPEEQQELLRQLQRREVRRMRERQKYTLPSDRALQSLRWHRKGELKLSENQQQQLAEFKEVMKPKIEAQLQELWLEKDQVQGQLAAVYKEGRRDEIGALSAEMRELHRQLSEAKRELDESYRSLLRTVLTPDQMAVVENQAQATAQGWEE